MNYTANRVALIKDTGDAKGRGVFAIRDIGRGEVVEVCPVLIVSYSLLPKNLNDVIFGWSSLTGEANPLACIALGWGSMYNHDNPENMRYIANTTNVSLEFIAAREIVSGEELTINYNESYVDIISEEDIWFSKKEISPI